MTCLSRHTYLVPSVWVAGSLFPPVLPLPSLTTLVASTSQ